jgi:hypothetical protein
MTKAGDLVSPLADDIFSLEMFHRCGRRSPMMKNVLVGVCDDSITNPVGAAISCPVMKAL